MAKIILLHRHASMQRSRAPFGFDSTDFEIAFMAGYLSQRLGQRRDGNPYLTDNPRINALIWAWDRGWKC